MAVSRPVLALGLVVVAAGLYWWSGITPEAKAKSIAKKPPAVYLVDAEPEFTDADYTAHFDKPKAAMRNLFLPLVISAKAGGGSSDAAGASKDIIKVPSDLAGGEADWIYTGFAIVDGERMALLENPGTHKAGYVKEGDAWKKARVHRITSESLLLAGADGIEKVVLRYNPDLAKKDEKKDEAVKPVNPGTPPLQGPIGPGAPNVQIVPAPGGQGVRIIRGMQP